MANDPRSNFKIHAQKVQDGSAAAALNCLMQMVEIQHQRIEDLERQLEQLRRGNTGLVDGIG